MSTEVGLLTRNIRVIGENYDRLQDESFGARILVGDFFDGNQQWTGGCGTLSLLVDRWVWYTVSGSVQVGVGHRLWQCTGGCGTPSLVVDR